MRALGATVVLGLALLCAPVMTASSSALTAASGGTFYVSPTGRDTNPGTKERPWRSIQHAADRLRAGQTVLIRTGIYRERVRPKYSGRPGAMISFRAFPGEIPTIDGARIELQGDKAGLFEIAGRAYIRVAGLRIINARPEGQSDRILVVESHDILLEGNRTANNRSSGIGVRASSRVTIRGTAIRRTLLAGGAAPPFISAASASIVDAMANVDGHAATRRRLTSETAGS